MRGSITVAVCLCLLSVTGRGQDSQSAPQIVRVEAYEGTPCGVGQITFRLPKQSWKSIQPQTLLRTGAVRVDDAAQRVLYPTFGQPPAARFFRGIVGPAADPTDQLYSCWFLFRGAGPFDLSILGCQTTTVRVTPRSDQSSRHLRMLNQWWKEYQRSAEFQREQGDYPDLVETYLLSMLSYRMQLALPKPRSDTGDPLQQTFELLMDAERLRSDLIREWYQGRIDLMPAAQPLPPPIDWTPVQVTGLASDVVVEPIAEMVPQDCFYLRFGTWDNQLWLKRLLDEFGGGLSQMVQLRGYQARIDSKFLDQLAIESTQLDEWFGGNLIQDVAIIGHDTYFDTGPAIGVLLHAKDTGFLQRQIEGRRNRFAQRDAETQVLQVMIGDARVSFLSTANHRYRSFYVVSGAFHLVTNSRAIAEKFLAGARGGPTLGRLPEFRYARQLMPLDRHDTVFVYFSTPFFQQLLSPQYQIELRRRSRALAEMQMMRLAQLAAAGEGYADAPLEFLSLHGFIPPRFLEQAWVGRYDFGQGGWQDATRGLRGFFLPIPDMEIAEVTPDEAAWFASRAKYFAEHFHQLDPLLVGIQRFDLGNRVERVVFDARLAPFAQDKYGWLNSMLGSPLAQSIQGSSEDAIRLQASLRGGLFGGDRPPYQLFASVQDNVDPRLDLKPANVFDAWKLLKQIPGYMGAMPAPGLVDWLPRLGGQPDAAGYTYSRLLDLWRYQKDDLSLLAFDRDRLERVKHEITIRDEPRPAQVRLLVADFNTSRLRNWANTVNFQRAWQTSIANVRLLNTLIDQFSVPPRQALAEAEELLDVRLVCTLGGQFQTLDRVGGDVWVSDAWPDFLDPSVPESYEAPILKWFRGLELEVTKTDHQFAVHGFLDIQRTDSGGTLPSFELFKGFQNLLSGDRATEKEKRP